AVSAHLDHLLQPAHLALDAAQPAEVLLALLGVAVRHQSSPTLRTRHPRSGNPAPSAAFADATLLSACRYSTARPSSRTRRAAVATNRRARPRPRPRGSVPTEISQPDSRCRFSPTPAR